MVSIHWSLHASCLPKWLPIMATRQKMLSASNMGTPQKSLLKWKCRSTSCSTAHWHFLCNQSTPGPEWFGWELLPVWHVGLDYTSLASDLTVTQYCPLGLSLVVMSQSVSSAHQMWSQYHLKRADLVGTWTEAKWINAPRGSGVTDLFSRAFDYWLSLEIDSQ